MKRALLIAVIIVMAAATCASAYSWQHVSSPGIGRMAVDPSGNAWLIAGGTLSKWNGSGWDKENLGGVRYSSNASLAFSSDGKAHIMYTERQDRWYVSKENGVWHQEYVTRNGAWAGESATIAIDSSGTIHTAYATDSSYFLYHATRNADGTWTSDLVDNTWGYNSAWWPDVKIDPVTGKTVIAYTTGQTDDLKIATGSPGNWSQQILESNMTTGWVPQLFITSDGRKIIGYGAPGYKHYGLKIQNPDGSYRSLYPGISSDFLFSLCLAADETPIMLYTENPTNNSHVDSPIYGCWCKSDGSIKQFTVGDGNVLCGTFVGNFTVPAVSSIVVGDTLFVNFRNASGAAETWYATVPEPSCVIALVTGLAGLGLIRRKRS